MIITTLNKCFFTVIGNRRNFHNFLYFGLEKLTKTDLIIKYKKDNVYTIEYAEDIKLSRNIIQGKEYKAISKDDKLELCILFNKYHDYGIDYLVDLSKKYNVDFDISHMYICYNIFSMYVDIIIKNGIVIKEEKVET